MDYCDGCICAGAQGGQSVCPADGEMFPKQAQRESSP